MYVITQNNNIWLILKNNTLSQTMEVTPITLSKNNDIIYDKDVITTINIKDVLFSTTNETIIKETLSENDTKNEIDTFLELEILNDDYLDFNENVLNEAYFKNIEDDPDYYIHLN